MQPTAKHVCKFDKITGKPIVPATSQEKTEADRMRSRKRGNSDNGQFQPYDYSGDDRVLIYGVCTCGKKQTIDLLPRDEAVKLYKKLGALRANTTAVVN